MSPLATVRVDQFSSQPTLVMAAALLLAVTLIYLAGLPGRVARRRARVRWRAIAAIGWLSLIVWPLWPGGDAAGTEAPTPRSVATVGAGRISGARDMR
jgi:hypothetical protein